MSFELIFPIAVMAFVCELTDSTIGMGYGTTLTPLLLMLGYEPLEIVPAILLAEFVTGILSGFFHHEFGNVNFRPGNRDFKVVVLIATLSIFGVIFAALLAVNLPSWLVKLYIGLLVLCMGLLILKHNKRVLPFSWRRIGVLGFLAAFNKGISGGGYGPVVTSGQVLSGVRGRNAVGIASLAEGITCMAGVAVYILSGASISWQLAPSLLIGSVLSVPIAVYVVSRIKPGQLTLLIGGVSTTLGGYTLMRLFF
jgi:uncharacterized membrane protein YfcA